MTTGSDILVSKHDPFLQAQRHSFLVKILKWILPAVALVGVIFFATSTIFAIEAKEELNVTGIGYKNGNLVMSNPRLDGFTKEKRRYLMTAAKAYQLIGNAARVQLTDIVASIPLDQDLTASILAEDGVYHSEAGWLNLNKPTVVKVSNGTTIKLNTARVKVDEGVLISEDPIEIAQNGSRLKADRVKVTDSGKTIVFEDDVVMIISPEMLKRQGIQ